MMKKWKKLSTKLLLDHPRMAIYEDEVELPNGLRTTYVHIGKINDAAMIIAIDDSGKIFVQKEYSYPPDEWLYQFPGGAFEATESPRDGAARELSEEANLAGELNELGWFYVDNRRKSSKFYVFVATNLIEKLGKKDPEEEFENFWFSETEIETMIQSGEIKNYSFLAGWSLYKSRRL